MTLGPALRAAVGVIGLTRLAAAEPAVPQAGSALASLEWGVFCALPPTRQVPAPGTLSGWIHVPLDEIAFQWPDRQTLPASLGLAFGVRARLASESVPFAEIRLFRPGSSQPEIWGTGFTALGETLVFFRFDREDELIPGPWRFEAWDGPRQMFKVEFEVVPASDLPDLADACRAVS